MPPPPVLFGLELADLRYSPLRPGKEPEESLGSVIKAALEATAASAAVGDVRTPRLR